MSYLVATPETFARAVATAAAHAPPLAVVVDFDVAVVHGRFAPGTHVQVVRDVADVVVDAHNPDLLGEYKAKVVDAINVHLRTVVDAHLPRDEREALAALLQKVTLMRMMGAPVDEGASLALVASLGWAQDMLALSATLAAAVDAAVDFDAVGAVDVDAAVAALAPPPNVTAAQIAIALRGGA
ncbi:MAG: hypothetical protein ACK52I_01695 [Pseudomonadota bacterium]